MDDFSKEKAQVVSDRGAANDGRTRHNSGRHCLLNECLILISLVIYLTDAVTDFFVGVHFLRGQIQWAALTLSLVVMPLFVIQIVSARLYAFNHQFRCSWAWLAHILPLQPLLRYIDALFAGIRAYRYQNPKKLEDHILKQYDVCLIRFFHVLLKSAPQLTLHTYIICFQDIHLLNVTSACMSLVALGWTAASYSISLHQVHAEEYLISWFGMVLQTSSVVCTVSSRAIAFAAFASTFGVWVFLVIGVHWIFMTAWSAFQKTEFRLNAADKVLFNCLAGALNCFSYFSIKEGNTCWQIVMYYAIIILENAAMMILWFCFGQTTAFLHYSKVTGIIAMCLMLMFGFCCTSVYYHFFHPEGPVILFLTCNSKEVNNKLQLPSQEPSLKFQPSCTSTVLMSRRILPKPAAPMSPVNFRSVSDSPLQLSPIARRNMTPHSTNALLYNDSTILRLSGYQHYSVNASACLHTSDLQQTNESITVHTPNKPS